MPSSNQNFFSIPDNSFSIFIGSNSFLNKMLDNVTQKFPHRKIQYIFYQNNLADLHISTEEKRRIEFIEAENAVDILAMLESDTASKIIIVYNPDWFKEHPEYIMPFGHLCRERSKRKREVILLSRINDKVLDEIEPVADKVVCVQDIIETPNNRTCNNSQITLKSLPEKESITKTPAIKYGQQVLYG